MTFTEGTILVFIPENKKLSEMHYKGDMEYANLFKDDQLSIDMRIYTFEGANPPKPQDFWYGPAGWANRYSVLRNYFNVGGEKVIW